MKPAEKKYQKTPGSAGIKALIGFEIVLIGLLSAGRLAAQDNLSPGENLDDRYEIRWVSSFPSDENPEKSGLKEKITELVFGKKQETIVKPFNILADDPENFLVLDQGSKSLVGIHEGHPEILKSSGREEQDFPSLVGICKMQDNSILFTDSRLNKIFKTDGHEVIPFGSGSVLQQPTGIAYSPTTGEVWVVETAAHDVVIFDRDGNVIRRVGERGTDPGYFNFPTFIWIDGNGKVYIVDSMNFRVQIFDEKGDFLLAFGEAGNATGYMARPKGIATDSNGNIYIADALFHVVQVFDPSGKLLYYFGGQGQGNGEFWMPAGIFIDQHDFIYVSDSYNARIQVFKLVKIQEDES